MEGMQKDARQRILHAIHAKPGRIVFVTAGAGTQALAWLQGVAGASRTLLEGIVPYSMAATIDLLDREPEKYVTPQTARWMAGRAFARAQLLCDPDEPIAGIACTATIATDRPKRGQHRAHIAVWKRDQVTTYSLTLWKGARTREGEENLVSKVLMHVLAESYGVESAEIPLRKRDHLTTSITDLTYPIHQVVDGTTARQCVTSDGEWLSETYPKLILSGSFNPLHAGHIKLAKAASAYCGHSVGFELSAHNVDKPPLSAETVLTRMAQFAGRWSLVVTNAPTFLDKARLLPNTTFVVGYDTAQRILMPRYYNNDVAATHNALQELSDLGTHFLVAGRVNDDDRFLTTQDLSIPAPYDQLFEPLPHFRFDVSSTELRQAGKRGSR